MRPSTPTRPPQAGNIQASFAKMKPYERILLISGVALLLVAGFLFQNYRQAQARNDKLGKQVLSSERTASNLKKDFDVATLEKKKADITQELDGPKNPWYKNFESLDVDNLITTSAVQTKVEVVKLTLNKVSKEKIGNIETTVESRHVQVRGELANIIRFIDQIERGPLTALRLGNIQITQIKGVWNGSLDIDLLYLAPQGGSDAGRKG